jgi:ParB family chromosome partitioning protein
MRHDQHYVEALAASAGEPVGRMVAIDLLDPNPNQPRQVMGDLSELMASVSEKGIIEPLVVRQRLGRYQIIAGERRYHAAVQVGLREVPVIIRESDDVEVMELALVENLQRKDLTAFEEAEALLQLQQKCGHTHEDLARKLGKSRTAITESLSLASMPDEVRNLCRLADITAKSTLLQIVRQQDPKKMLALVEKLAGQGAATRQAVRQETAKPKPGRPRPTCSRSSANQGVRSEIELQENQGRTVRDHRSAREHHSRVASIRPEVNPTGRRKASTAPWRQVARNNRKTAWKRTRRRPRDSWRRPQFQGRCLDIPTRWLT